MGIAEDAAALVADAVFAVPPPLPDLDARTHALRALRLYLSKLDFARSGAKLQPDKVFRIPIEDIHIEQPDNVVDLKFPSIAFIPTRGTQDSVGLGGPSLCEDSIDKFGKGTALVKTGEYLETFTIEVWGSKIPERRALLAGLKMAFRPSFDTSMLRLKLHDYFDTVAVFSLNESQYIDEPDVVRNRRRGQLFVQLQVCELELVNYGAKLNSSVQLIIGTDVELTTVLDVS